MYTKTCFGPLTGASGFAQFTIKKKQNMIFVQNLNYFMCMRSSLRMKRTKLQTINISSATFCYSTDNMTPSLKSNCMKAP